MPTYEYSCDACGHDFEAFQFLSEAPVDTCPACGASNPRKLPGKAVVLHSAPKAPACATGRCEPGEMCAPMQGCAAGSCAFGGN